MIDRNALIQLGRWLGEEGYRFAAISPACHARRRLHENLTGWRAQNLADVFGWNRPFDHHLLPARVVAWLDEGGALEHRNGLLRTKVGFSTFDGDILIHSAYSSTQSDLVRFDADTCRFVSRVRDVLQDDRHSRIRRIVEIGCGTGAGAIAAVRQAQTESPEVIVTDMNPLALVYAQINAVLAGIPRPMPRQGDLYRAFDGKADLIIANVCGHGVRGGAGRSLPEVRVIEEGLARLNEGGRMIVQANANIIDGADSLRTAIDPVLRDAGLRYGYQAIDEVRSSTPDARGNRSMTVLVTLCNTAKNPALVAAPAQTMPLEMLAPSWDAA